MDAREFIDAQHGRLRAKAHRIDNCRGARRYTLLADYVADAELHAQLVEDALEYATRLGNAGTPIPVPTGHADAEVGLLAAVESLDGDARAWMAELMKLRRRALDRKFLERDFEQDDED